MIVRFLRTRALCLPVIATSLVALLVLAACGSGSSGGSSTPTTGGSGGTFPATVTHKFGTTTVPAAPQRVVSLGYTDQDAILALGVVPVGVREFTGDQPSATWPWAQPKLDGQTPTVLPVGDVSTEAIAALRPDLIVGISAGLTQETYATYSKIAPTIAQPAGFVDYGTPWQDATTLTGKALGKTAEADKLIADTDAGFVTAKSTYPALVGKSVAAVRPSSADNASFFVWGSQDLRGRFLESLGMTIPAEFDTLAGSNFYATISTEQLSKLDQADVVVLVTASAQERQAFESLPGYGNLKAVQQNKIIVLDDDESAALSFSSVLSLPSVLETLPAKLATAAG
ncbi:iron-siderophore ABC transporter substrate-binding protein [Pseudonocardia sp. N23]|uniref:iron-siderophore ABC transporter substrate-binding protein n=1 Tax=Pseudonocardia sp. N23 TaxID=1987376 RepID=UPI000BFCC48C|nr:iron-siderophore ABC transporter substrate-binding protein [Pseudonocardia sp. N23]GAY09572.1 ABC-type Fe3+-siderophore transport system, periplasmic iron-binding component [Pseudonocardia sp. N23]